MPNPILVQCPMCKKNWIDEVHDAVCNDCQEPLAIDMAVFEVHSLIRRINQMNFSKFTEQHLQVLKNASTNLEGVINVLGRHRKQ